MREKFLKDFKGISAFNFIVYMLTCGILWGVSYRFTDLERRVYNLERAFDNSISLLGTIRSQNEYQQTVIFSLTQQLDNLYQQKKSKPQSKYTLVYNTVSEAFKWNNCSDFPTIHAGEVAQAIVDSSQRFKLPSSLILATAYTESAFCQYAVSKVGARGVMQLMPNTILEISEELKQDYSGSIRDNVVFGTYYLSKMLKRFSNLEQALHAYNAGPTNIENNILPTETIQYASSIQSRMLQFAMKGI